MKFLIWAKDRFPFLNVTTSFVMATAAKLAVEAGPALHWSLRDGAAELFILSHLFILRVLDEHKDFKSDQIFHPERALQRGLISLRDIKKYGWIAFVIQVLSYLVLDPHLIVFPIFVFLWVWTFLMFKEFGIRQWLRSHIFIYSLSHLMISPILFWLVMSGYIGEVGVLTAPMITLLTLSLETGLLYEITRKNKSVEEDKKGEISFSSTYGRGAVTGYISLAGLLAVTSGALFLKQLGAWTLSFGIGSGVIQILLMVTLLNFWKNPTPQGRKKNEGVAGLLAAWVLIYPIVRLVVLATHFWSWWP